MALTRGATEVTGASVELTAQDGSCPTLSATADLNGTPMVIYEAGGRRSTGDYYGIPTSTCKSPSYVYNPNAVSESQPAKIALGVPVTLTVTDGASTLRLVNEEALVFTPQAVAAASRRGGDPLEFEFGAPVNDVTLVSYSVRSETTGQFLLASSFTTPSVSGARVVTTVPTGGADIHLWTMEVRVRLPNKQCTGVGMCQPLSVGALWEFRVSVGP